MVKRQIKVVYAVEKTVELPPRLSSEWFDLFVEVLSHPAEGGWKAPTKTELMQAYLEGDPDYLIESVETEMVALRAGVLSTKDAFLLQAGDIEYDERWAPDDEEGELLDEVDIARDDA
jgi:hypothetical protein